MDKLLTEKETTELSKYRFNAELDRFFEASNVLDEAFLKKFMANLSSRIGASSEKVAASIFIKRYAFLAVIALYAMTAWSKKINVSLDGVTMESASGEGNWLPSFSFKDITVQEWNGAVARSEWRKRVIRDLFAKNIYPIIAFFEKTFGISRFILWENIAVYVFWVYESELTEHENALEDFTFLIFEANGSLFGRYKQNPLQKYYAEKSYLEEWSEEVRIRKTCCFTYQLEGSSKRCKTCPCNLNAKNGRCQDGEGFCSAIRGLA
ncbi:IucA/IucC family C-terminal-domain containing protein [Neobacillus sp. 114]|uniref:IucA/IucC family C-terminal-domain containing protein n=1 Tax=Neobacillus sp. 114 TaxID=3048535 RepID=UPI0024C46BEF|nr:IucA/IucC family C-terminal-domain containing protein [Neobacillus sp. 114]